MIGKESGGRDWFALSMLGMVWFPVFFTAYLYVILGAFSLSNVSTIFGMTFPTCAFCSLAAIGQLVKPRGLGAGLEDLKKPFILFSWISLILFSGLAAYLIYLAAYGQHLASFDVLKWLLATNQSVLGGFLGRIISVWFFGGTSNR